MRSILRSWPRGTPLVLEATFGWGWVADEAEAAGLEPHLASSRKLAAWREARGLAKSNRLDADLLGTLMYERQPWWEVWLAPPPVRDERELLRYRMGLVQAQTAFKNRIHAVLHRHGILHEFADLFGRDGRRFLQKLANVRTSELRDSGRTTLRGQLQLLDHLRLQIARVTREFREQVKRSPAAQRLKTLPGVSWILAYTLMAEIGDIRRFKTSKHLASYSLLAPRANDSGEDDGSNPLGRHVGFAGRRTLKWAFIEAAHAAVRKDERLRAIFNRRTDDGKRDRNRGYIAVGRHLSVSAFVVWKKEQEYNPCPPPRPGSAAARRPSIAAESATPRAAAIEVQVPVSASQAGRRKASKESPAKRKRNKTPTSRPGTGQPEHPMVPAAAVSRQLTSL
jgi:transposase